MRTVPEFESLGRDHDRLLARVHGGVLICGVLGIAVGGAAFNPLSRQLSAHLPDPAGPLAAAGLILVAFFAPMVLICWLAERRIDRLPGAECPGCGKPLAHAVARQKVIATRCCPHCSLRLVADPDEAPERPLRTVAEVEAIDRAGSRRAMVWLAGGFAAMFAGTALYTALAETVGGGRKLGLFGRAVENPAVAAALDLAVLLVVGFVPFVGGAVGFMAHLRRTERRPEVRCPHCDGRLRVGLLRATGNCGHCGRRAVADPPAGA